ncbi:MAG TPA: hypothetical protein VGS08_01695 [Candidatus Saccharimonadales bacterium]|nr:hypothetical protein [Candidatus Saccharimonadales bacterium]
MGEKEAADKYLLEVEDDPTFPDQATLDSLNKPFNGKLKLEEYRERVKLAKEQSYEWSEKPAI